jgi:hypothetical protein
MQYQQTPQGLESMFGSNVANGGGSIASTPSMMALLGQQQGADQLTSLDNQRQYGYDTLNDPLKLQEKDLQNQTLAEALPGVTARAKEDTRKAANGALLNDDEIASLRGKYKTEHLTRHVQDMENVGQVALQQSEGAWANPLGAHARAKQAFIDAGHGDMWNPDWDSMNSGDLADKLGLLGKGIQATNASMSKSLMTAQAKGDAALDVQREKNVALREATKARAESADKLTAAKLQIAATKQSEQNYAVQMAALAEKETDPDQKAKYLKAANDAYAKAYALAAAPAATAAAVKPDTNALGVPSNGNPANPAITGAQPPAGAASAPPPAAPPAKKTMGVTSDSPEGQSWIARAMKANPGMSNVEILSEGYKAGVLK